MRKKIIFGNWKMNGTNAEVKAFLELVNKNIEKSDVIAGLGLPFTALQTGIDSAKNVKIAAENVHFDKNGAYTGEVSIQMLKEIGVEYVIIGHSERREMFNETDITVNLKAKALLENKMIPIICCGETLQTKEAGQTIAFVNNQINKAYENISKADALKTIIAYEPIWAIGTGKTATAQDAQDVCLAIRQNLAKIYDQTTADQITIQYGGSVKPGNIKELMEQPDIDGALVGGASLIADDYVALINYSK
ncbi:triose-phosphate isomerase [Williamsoniiplasma luminosum]|uniref:Triosephosphate isomerase n=1 Tax=Williamsoniiplasma luminosum TaxID=214888 RepID=A0A2S0NK52_9MOLU|nr:triose-phosphate isomerase [Williamsoniiplasma luminosum]AVP49400.1 MAG: triose-phosphate isomerase [Williamsoniiplasma luminosum]